VVLVLARVLGTDSVFLLQKPVLPQLTVGMLIVKVK